MNTPLLSCAIVLGIASIAVAERMGPNAKVVTLMVDSGLKYLNTDVYRSRSDT